MYTPRQRDNGMEKTLTLKIVTPDGTAAEYPCTSLRLPVKDTLDGRGGGSYGIHPGHLPALFALSENERVTAIPEEAPDKPLQIAVRGGIAAVAQNVVTILTDGCTME